MMQMIGATQKIEGNVEIIFIATLDVNNGIRYYIL